MRKSLLALVSLSISVSIAACGKSSGDKSAGPTPNPNGTPSDVYPAFPPPMPEVTRQTPNGVLASPVLVAVTYANDPNRSDMETFVNKMASSEYWSTVTSEYGVGKPTVGTPIELTDSAGAAIAGSSIPTFIATSAGGPGWGAAPTANTVYLMFYPAGTSITDPSGNSCTSYGAYHAPMQIGQLGVAYAVIPRCPGQGSFTDVDVATFAGSHEIVEAVTDPLGGGYIGPNPNAGAWDLMSNDEELGDYCEWQPGAFMPVEADIGFPTQATWSNAAAAAGHNPCQPNPISVVGPYFNAAPVLKQTASINLPQFGSEQTPTVQIAVGKTSTIELDLYSDAATSGPFTVSAIDLASAEGQPAELSFAFDKTSGVNGEKLHLTVTVIKAGALIPGGSVFLISSTLGTQQNFWPVYVADAS